MPLTKEDIEALKLESRDDINVEEEAKKREEEAKKKEEDKKAVKGEKDKKEPKEDKEKLATQKRLADYYYNVLKEDNVLEDGLEVNNMKELNEAIEKSKDQSISEYLNQMPEDIRKAVESYNKGIDYTKIQKHDAALTEYSKISEDSLKEDKELALELIRKSLKNSEDDEEYIKNRLSVIEDSDTYFIEGKRALRLLVNREKTIKNSKEQEELLKARALEEQAEGYRTSIRETIEDKDKLWGMAPTKEEKAKVLMAMLQPDVFRKKYKNLTPFEELTAKPEVLTQIYYMYVKGAFGKDGKLDFITSEAKTKAVNEIDALINKASKASFNNATDNDSVDGLSIMENLAMNLKPR